MYTKAQKDIREPGITNTSVIFQLVGCWIRKLISGDDLPNASMYCSVLSDALIGVYCVTMRCFSRKT